MPDSYGFPSAWAQESVKKQMRRFHIRIVCMCDAVWDQVNAMGIIQMGLREAGELLQRNESQIAHLSPDVEFCEGKAAGWSLLLGDDRDRFGVLVENGICRQTWATRRLLLDREQAPCGPSWLTNRGHHVLHFSLSRWFSRGSVPSGIWIHGT